MPKSPESPCVNVCQVDPMSQMCRGCGRTLHEIANWTAIGPEGRLRVLEDLLSRMMHLQRNGLALPPRDLDAPVPAKAKPYQYKFKRKK